MGEFSQAFATGSSRIISAWVNQYLSPHCELMTQLFEGELILEIVIVYICESENNQIPGSPACRQLYKIH